MQTYQPAGPGMIICDSGGEYVLVSEVKAEIERRQKALDLILSYFTDHPELTDREAVIKRVVEICLSLKGGCDETKTMSSL
jgi:hypothetical protein